MASAVLCAVASLLTMSPGAPALGQAALRLAEFVIPTPNSMPHSIAAAPDGRIYFSELAGNKVATFDPRT